MALNQLNQNQTGKLVGQAVVASSGEFGDTLVSELQPRYYEQAYRGQTYFISVAAAAGTAYTGAAGGTPLVGIWNPANSGKNLVLLQASVGVVAAGSGVGNTQFRLYGGATATLTGTLVSPVSTLTFNSTGGGSVARAISNAATTSSTALTYIMTIGNYYWATAAGAYLSAPIIYDCSGALIIPPGSMLALGAVTIPTSMTNDAFLMWSEVAI